MPGIVPNRRKYVDMLSDDEEESDTRSSVSIGSKRARYEHDASVESLVSSLHVDGHQNVSRPLNGYDDADDYSQDAHQPGSLVRIHLKNFVTYTEAEFSLGPSLNMIIGPNGTGKSTLVCAICLGLGWSPVNLGRAKEIGEFVKHGNTEAKIEIEIAGKDNQRNPIIGRTIRKEGNKSHFYINGRQVIQKEVVKLARSFSIQIDNLCQFLPQDRVVEFAALQPIALLTETQRAAAPEQMVIWHDNLKELRREEKRFEVEQKNEDAHLKTLQARQEATRHDVERWNERQDLVTKSKVLEKCRPLVEIRRLKNQVEEMKAEKTALKRELQQLVAESEPARVAQENMESYRDQIDQITQARKHSVNAASKRAESLASLIKREQDTISEFSNQVTAEKEGEKQRRQDVKRLVGVISQIERSMQEEPVEYDPEKFEGQLRELRSKVGDCERRDVDIRANMAAIVRQVKDLRQAFQEKTNERASLDTQSGQQANLLLKVSPDTAHAWDWIQLHRDSLGLKGEIHGPPILNCSVTEPHFAGVVENALGGLADMTAITCTSIDDTRKLTDKIFAETGLHNFTLRTIPKPLSYYRSPVTREQLAAYGFEGWVIDYIRGPEPVLAMLCENSKIHRTAYAAETLPKDRHDVLAKSPIQVWIEGPKKYRVSKRSEYNQSSTLVIELKPARIFTDQPVDGEEKRRLDNEVREIERLIQELRQQHSSLKEEQQRLAEQNAQAKKESHAIKQEIKAKQKAVAEFQLLPEKKANKEAELRGLEDLTRETGHRILEIKANSEKSALKVASLTLDYVKAVATLRQAHENLVEAEIRLIEANCEVESLKDENAHITQALQDKKAAFKQLDAQKKTRTSQYNNMVRRLQQDLNDLSEEEMDLARKYQESPDLDNEIAVVETRLQMMADGNPSVVRAYEKREQEIENTQRKLQKIADDLSSTQAEITSIRDQWEPELDRLVAKISDGFSHNFEQIGCAGQVGVYKDEDFENWSIQIQVRFRENESMSVLDSHRQSGGERAVSTIFYLMALQDMARSPFRVVDEINQGMDPRNERMVHERMVDIACRERTSQYFLITPKLLNDLKFHPKMTVHCIASGEHMPAGNDELDFRKLSQLALRINKG
ncbi:structural maintenance of chromosomes protein-like protein 5 [Lojkania enalia]|uniref:Structural maintenance of chromosomes protein 5 n=1 Tax=Lojkania enalia TaxID=147567 RepID=A0A9P4JYX2_9PLEO|nr:structural maintenance of chromosomes protein-like protein 5 [Didymosphaeria enalia]